MNEQDLRRQKIDIALKFLKLRLDQKARSEFHK